MNTLTDEWLFRQVQQGKEDAFRELMQRYSGRLYRLVYKHVGTSAITKDILQEIFIAVWKNRHRIIVGTSLYPYLYRAAKNAVIDHVLQEQRNMPMEEALTETMATTHPGAEEQLYLQELEASLQQSVNMMPATMKAVFVLSREEQLSSREIAARLNLSEQTVRNNISLALQRIRHHLGMPGLLLLLPSALIFDFLVTLS
ncbi:RNA polymerase sigma factor [Chitinophaga solisilvae]|uniref:RNA polymerase sigma factor n=1 Tax=Chitinophaga solisilvae TaxID=1233460 RepID=UPI00136C16D2|nr:RNA polymerase sigma-70 factor [Chitinophaga solisilvae]